MIKMQRDNSFFGGDSEWQVFTWAAGKCRSRAKLLCFWVMLASPFIILNWVIEHGSLRVSLSVTFFLFLACLMLDDILVSHTGSLSSTIGNSIQFFAALPTIFSITFRPDKRTLNSLSLILSSIIVMCSNETKQTFATIRCYISLKCYFSDMGIVLL